MEEIKKIIDGAPPQTHECNSKEETINIEEVKYETDKI